MVMALHSHSDCRPRDAINRTVREARPHLE